MAQIRAEHRKIGYRALAHLPPKTMPEGKVAVHIPPGDHSVGADPDRRYRAMRLRLVDAPPAHYREKKGIKRPLNRRPVQRPAIRRMT
jgi:hypothetical protein